MEALYYNILYAIESNSFFKLISIVILSLLAAVISKLILKGLSAHLRKQAQKTESIWDDVAIDLVDGLRNWVLFIWATYFLSRNHFDSAISNKFFLIIIVVASIFQVWIWGNHIINNWYNSVLLKKIEKDPSSAAALELLHKGVKALFIAVIILIGLSNLNIDIGALLTGLGVGGIAIALAAQNVLGDILASLSIVLDKPFGIGDFIVIGDKKGTVEHIGIKTTRLRSLSGEELVISNKDLLEGRIHNYKKMNQRRVVHNFGVLYSTPSEKLQLIPIWVKEFIEQHRELKFERCHLNKYGASSLDYEFAFIVTEPDYNLYMDLQQQLLLNILKKFAEEGVEFAYPTQTVYIAKNS